MNRRYFVRNAALVASAAAWPARAALADVGPFAEAEIAVVDRNLPGSAAFASAARARGLTALEFTGDAAEVWMRELEPRLRLGRVAIAGHTSAATWFCLDLLARDFGARTVQRVATGAAVSFVLSQYPGRRAPLAPAFVRAQWSDTHA